MEFNELLEERYNLLTKSEKKIAEYISKSEGKIIYSPMSTVKEEVGVGDATIIRFCNKLGFTGFTDLKIEIAKEDFSKNHFNSKYDYINESEEKITKSIKNTKKHLRDESLNRAINMIKKASNIYLFGVGSSGNTCKDFEAMLLRVGIKAKAVTDPHFQAQLSSILDNNDLVIGFSLSGKTKDTIESLFLAKENFAKIISITNNKLSPIANLSEIVLQTSTNEFFDGASLAGKISQLYICDVLIKGFELEDNANTIEIREKVIRSVLDKSID